MYLKINIKTITQVSRERFETIDKDTKVEIDKNEFYHLSSGLMAI